jgi:uncharacterized protein (DUF1778 family)
MLQYEVSRLTLWPFCCYNHDMAGRPKKPKAASKTYMLRIRMTEEERALLDQAANARSLQLSSWARSELLALARKLLGGKR